MHQTIREHLLTVIDADYLAPDVASIHMLESRQNGAALIDTGTVHSVENVQRALRARGLGFSDVRYVIVTHVHLDHAGGAGALMARAPNAELVVHPRGAPHMIDPTKLVAGTIGVYGQERTEQLYGNIEPVAAHRVIESHDGMILRLGERRLKFIDTPGHAKHHHCIVVEDEGIVFAGDTAGVSYRALDGANGPFLFPTTTPVQFDPPALHDSFDKLLSYQPNTLCLTHYGPIRPTAELAEEFHSQLEHYLVLARTSLNGSRDGVERLETRLSEYLAERASARGTPLGQQQIQKFLELDVKLNAQGLVVWWRRHHA